MHSFAASVLALASLASPAAAHGGVYIGPGATVPPGGSPGGPSSTSAGAPVTDPAAWDVWWSLNREPFLALESAARGTATGAGEAVARDDARPDERVVRERVVPALVAALRKSQDVDLVTGAMLALAKIGERGFVGGDDPVALFRGFLDHPNQEVHETAALALGVLASSSAATTLAELLADSSAARKLVGERGVAVRTRAFAAYGLALTGAQARNDAIRRYAVHHLVRALAADDLPAEVEVACIVALGLLPLEDVPAQGDAPPEATHSRRGQIELLLARWNARGTRDAQRAQLPVALARLCEGIEGAERARVIDALADTIAPTSRASEAVVQGAIQGLALLGDDDDDPHDAALRGALERCIERGDRTARNLALLALGRVAARAGQGAPGEGAKRARTLLIARLARGDGVEKPWAALALALLERARAARGDGPSAAVIESLRHALDTEAAPLSAGAYCLALALLGDLTSAPAIAAHVENGDENLRGYAAIALGLLRAQESVPMLRGVVVEKTRYRPGLLREASIALALLGDKSIVPYLVDRLRASTTMIELVATASALGWVGDARAVDPLVAIVADERADDTSRAFAAVALGQICDKEPMPWNARLAADASWLGAPPTLYDPLLGKGVLDLL